MEQTLAIIKPNVANQQFFPALTEMLNRFQQEDLSISLLCNQVQLTPSQAAEFYAEHEGKPFYSELVKFMSSGSSCFIILSGDNAIQKWRDMIGSTSPENRDPNSLRAIFGSATNSLLNGFHGSDSQTSFARERDFLFKHFLNH